MFVRIRERPLKTGTAKYAYLVKNQWNSIKKKHQQKTIACLGNVATLPVDGTIEKMIVALDKFATKLGYASLANGIVLSDLTDEKILSSSYDWGAMLLANHVLKRLCLTELIREICDQDTEKKVSSTKALAATIALLAHRFTPRTNASERATYQWYDKKIFLVNKKELAKDDLYRTLDVLISHKDEIEREYYERNRDLFSGSLDLVLFDTTSIYYWGWQEQGIKYTPEDLLQYGFSKDGKDNLKQVIVGVLMTSDGVPIAHEVFPGNTADVKAFSQMVSIVKKKYRLN